MSSNPVWVFGEISGKHIGSVTYEVLLRGRALADKLCAPLEVFLAAEELDHEEIQEIIYRGADKVLAALSPLLKDASTETEANIFADMIRDRQPEIILAAATTTGRTIMPCIAARIHTGLTADCTELDIEEGTRLLLQTRPAIGGNIMATIKTPKHRPQMCTVRPHSTSQAQRDTARSGKAEYVPIKDNLIDNRVKFLGVRYINANEMDIQSAKTIVAGGRGMKKKENFSMLKETADLLGGAVGASRDAVDRGWAYYPQQVGLSGKTVVPKLYIAAGISGAIQHLAGMKTAETIIAINNDPEAQIFKVADFGIIGDLFEILPLLNKRLREEVKL